MNITHLVGGHHKLEVANFEYAYEEKRKQIPLHYYRLVVVIITSYI
jgi:hypothetical protein